MNSTKRPVGRPRGELTRLIACLRRGGALDLNAEIHKAADVRIRCAKLFGRGGYRVTTSPGRISVLRLRTPTTKRRRGAK